MLAVFDNLHSKNSLLDIYDKLNNKINYPNEVEKTTIKIFNLTPIFYKGIKFLITSFLGLEHLFLNRNNKIIIKYFFEDETFGNIIINKHLNLLNIKKFNLDFFQEYDSFYDEHTQLLFIKFQDICIEYFDISDFNLNRLINTSFKNQKVNISFIDNSVNKITIETEILSDYIFKNKYFTFHDLPYLTALTQTYLPRKGAPVVNYNNDFIGIVNYISSGNKIMITPLMNIIRSLKYLESKVNILYTLDFDYIVEKIENLDDKSSLKNVLKITKNITDNSKISNIYIMSVDDNLISDNGNIIYNDINIPLKTYIWLNMLNKINITYLKYEDTKFITKKKIIYLKKWYKISNISVSKLNYFNTKNKFIIELNEKILSIIVNYLNNNPNYITILDKIHNDRFSILRKKILLFIKLNKNSNHHFELIEDYVSIADINEKLNTTKSLEIKLSNDIIKLVKN
jgi:hypothetical protein